MKKALLICSVLLFSSTAFGSKARLKALGQNSETGSFYISDIRSVFYNPAYLNFEKNLLAMEWGKASELEDSDTDPSPNAEGGVFGDVSSFAMGLYFGNESNSNNSYKNTKFLKQDNRADIFLAGDAGMLWGLNFYLADSSDESTGVKRSNNAYGLSLGVILDAFEFSADLGLADVSEGADESSDKWEGDLSVNIKSIYRYKDTTMLLRFHSYTFEQKVAGSNSDGEFTEVDIAVGKIIPVNKTAKIYADFQVQYNDIVDKNNPTYSTEKSYIIPVNIAFEADIKPWLQFRGAISQSVWSKIKRGNETSSDLNSTSVTAGLGAHFDQFNIDGIVGQESDGDKKGEFGTVTRVAVEYLF